MVRIGLLALALVALSACAQPVDEPTAVCEAAAAQLVACGQVVDQSPFGTCQPEQRAQAEALLSVYDADGCVALTDAKADGFACRVLPFLCVQHSPDELIEFRTDGCSMFPDGVPGDPTRWLHCCIEHDVAYYIGGPREARKAADEALAMCVTDVTNEFLGGAMYAGVRIGGTPALPTPFRWGYGWQYDPTDGYRDLSDEEQAAAQEQVAAWRGDPVPPDAIEQRLLGLWDVIYTVPGLEGAVERMDTEVMTYELCSDDNC